ncbi:MAG TPA: hypothetical protein VJ765_00935 [Chitinophagaceae bacterium]|nr:hypothetical protein [Chitinophagaceae bacterium]
MTDFVVVFGITTFTGFGGSFFTIGFIWGFTETRDLFSWPAAFGLAGFSAVFLAAILAGFCGTAFFWAGLAAFLGAPFLTGFLGVDFFVTVFFTGLVAFFCAGFFLLAIRLSFF